MTASEQMDELISEHTDEQTSHVNARLSDDAILSLWVAFFLKQFKRDFVKDYVGEQENEFASKQASERARCSSLLESLRESENCDIGLKVSTLTKGLQANEQAKSILSDKQTSQRVIELWRLCFTLIRYHNFWRASNSATKQTSMQANEQARNAASMQIR